MFEHGLAVDAELNTQMADGTTSFVLSDEICNSFIGEADLPLQCPRWRSLRHNR